MMTREIRHNGQAVEVSTAELATLCTLGLVEWREEAGAYGVCSNRGKDWSHVDSAIAEMRAPDRLTDTAAMQAIQQVMSGTEWTSDTIGEVAEIMRGAGYEIRDNFFAAAPDGE